MTLIYPVPSTVAEPLATCVSLLGHVPLYSINHLLACRTSPVSVARCAVAVFFGTLLGLLDGFVTFVARIGPALLVARLARLLALGDGTFLAPTNQTRRVASVIFVCVDRLETTVAEVAAAEESGNTGDGVKVAGPCMID